MSRCRLPGGYSHKILLLLCVVLAGPPLPGLAQVPGIERRSLPGGVAPEFELPAPLPPAPDLSLPPLPALPRPGPGQGPSVFVRDIRLEGNTVLGTAELEPILRRYQGREVTTEELLRLRDELTLAYVERGYVNSGAVIPDQEVVDGVITLQIIEGRLAEMRLEGLRSLDSGFLERRIRQGAGPPLNVRDLQERLQLLLLDPSIDRLNARLGPGGAPGESRLEVDFSEARRLWLAARFANDESPSVGEEHGEIEAIFRNVVGRSDPLWLRAGATEGLRQASAAYSLPLTARDLRLRLAGEITEGDVVEEPFNELDIESNSWSFEVGLSHPVFERLEDEVRLELALTREHSETSLLGEPFSFSPGVEDGESDVTALRFRQDWLHRGRDTALAFRSTFSRGIEALGGTDTDSPDAPDGQFFSWLGQLEVAQRLFSSEHQILFRASAQYTTDPLLPFEQFAIGGIDTVRGYRENLLVLDKGFAASLEYRLPLVRLPVPWLSERPEDGILFLAPFADIGGGRNNSRPTPDPDLIYSIGTGLRWSPAPGFSLAIYAGLPLRDVADPEDEGLQDKGIHFALQARLY
jgi:hemolysin activation/secretion protein